MRYLIRSVKYFIQVSVLLGAILLALMLSGLISKDVNVAFQHGWKSVGYIALMFAAVSAVYPLFGYTRRSVKVLGDPSLFRETIEKTFRDRGYVFESEKDGALRFHLASPAARIFRLWEDRITVTPKLGYLELEGLGRDLVRLVSALEHKLKDYGN